MLRVISRVTNIRDNNLIPFFLTRQKIKKKPTSVVQYIIMSLDFYRSDQSAGNRIMLLITNCANPVLYIW